MQTVELKRSFVDGIGSKTVFAEMLRRAQALLAGSLVASLVEIGKAMRLLAERNRVIAEGAGACPVGVALSGASRTLPNPRKPPTDRRPFGLGAEESSRPSRVPGEA